MLKFLSLPLNFQSLTLRYISEGTLRFDAPFDFLPSLFATARCIRILVDLKKQTSWKMLTAGDEGFRLGGSHGNC